MSTWANSDDSDEMPHITAFLQGLKFAKTKMIFRERNSLFLFLIITCDPLIYTMDHLKFIVLNQKVESIREIKG